MLIVFEPLVLFDFSDLKQDAVPVKIAEPPVPYDLSVGDLTPITSCSMCSNLDQPKARYTEFCNTKCRDNDGRESMHQLNIGNEALKDGGKEHDGGNVPIAIKVDGDVLSKSIGDVPVKEDGMPLREGVVIVNWVKEPYRLWSFHESKASDSHAGGLPEADTHETQKEIGNVLATDNPQPKDMAVSQKENLRAVSDEGIPTKEEEEASVFVLEEQMSLTTEKVENESEKNKCLDGLDIDQEIDLERCGMEVYIRDHAYEGTGTEEIFADEVDEEDKPSTTMKQETTATKDQETTATKEQETAEEFEPDGSFIEKLSSKITDSWFIFRNFTTDFVGSAANLSVNNVTTQLKENVESLRHQIKDAVDNLQKSNITSHVKDNVQNIGSHFKDAASHLKSGNISNAVKELVEDMGEQISEAVSSFEQSNITSQIKDGLQNLGDSIQGAISDLKEKGKQMKEPIKETMKMVNDYVRGKPRKGQKEDQRRTQQGDEVTTKNTKQDKERNQNKAGRDNKKHDKTDTSRAEQGDEVTTKDTKQDKERNQNKARRDTKRHDNKDTSRAEQGDEVTTKDTKQDKERNQNKEGRDTKRHDNKDTSRAEQGDEVTTKDSKQDKERNQNKAGRDTKRHDNKDKASASDFASQEKSKKRNKEGSERTTSRLFMEEKERENHQKEKSQKRIINGEDKDNHRGSDKKKQTNEKQHKRNKHEKIHDQKEELKDKHSKRHNKKGKETSEWFARTGRQDGHVKAHRNQQNYQKDKHHGHKNEGGKRKNTEMKIDEERPLKSEENNKRSQKEKHTRVPSDHHHKKGQQNPDIRKEREDQHRDEQDQKERQNRKGRQTGHHHGNHKRDTNHHGNNYHKKDGEKHDHHKHNCHHHSIHDEDIPHSKWHDNSEEGNEDQQHSDSNEDKDRFQNLNLDDLFGNLNIGCHGVKDCLRKQREAAVKLYQELLQYQEWLTKRCYKKHLKELEDFMEELEEFLAEPSVTDNDLEELMEDFEDMAEDLEEATTKYFSKFMKGWTERMGDAFESSSRDNGGQHSSDKQDNQGTDTLTVTLDLMQIFNLSMYSLNDDSRDESTQENPEGGEKRKHAGYGFQSNDDWFIRRMHDREDQRQEHEHHYDVHGDGRDSHGDWYKHWMKGREDGRVGATVWDLYQWFSKRQALRHEWRLHEMDDQSNWFLRRP